MKTQPNLHPKSIRSIYSLPKSTLPFLIFHLYPKISYNILLMGSLSSSLSSVRRLMSIMCSRLGFLGWEFFSGGSLEDMSGHSIVMLRIFSSTSKATIDMVSVFQLGELLLGLSAALIYDGSTVGMFPSIILSENLMCGETVGVFLRDLIAFQTMVMGFFVTRVSLKGDIQELQTNVGLYLLDLEVCILVSGFTIPSMDMGLASHTIVRDEDYIPNLYRKEMTVLYSVLQASIGHTHHLLYSLSQRLVSAGVIVGKWLRMVNSIFHETGVNLETWLPHLMLNEEVLVTTAQVCVEHVLFRKMDELNGYWIRMGTGMLKYVDVGLVYDVIPDHTFWSGPIWNDEIDSLLAVNETWQNRRLIENTMVFSEKLAWNIAIYGLNIGGLDAYGVISITGNMEQGWGQEWQTGLQEMILKRFAAMIIAVCLTGWHSLSQFRSGLVMKRPFHGAQCWDKFFYWSVCVIMVKWFRCLINSYWSEVWVVIREVPPFYEVAQEGLANVDIVKGCSKLIDLEYWRVMKRVEGQQPLVGNDSVGDSVLLIIEVKQEGGLAPLHEETHVGAVMGNQGKGILACENDRKDDKETDATLNASRDVTIISDLLLFKTGELWGGDCVPAGKYDYMKSSTAGTQVDPLMAGLEMDEGLGSPVGNCYEIKRRRSSWRPSLWALICYGCW